MISTTDNWYSPEMATFGDRLAAARENAQMSQSQLARRLGVKLSTLRGWENDLSEPRANRLQMVAGLLNVSLTWLLTAEGDGIDGPVDEAPAPNLNDIFVEIRSIKTDMKASADRLGRLEKKLRQALAEGTT